MEISPSIFLNLRLKIKKGRHFKTQIKVKCVREQKESEKALNARGGEPHQL